MENSQEKLNTPDPQDAEPVIPDTLPGMLEELESVFVQLETIRSFPMSRNIEQESLPHIIYGNRILGRMKKFLDLEKNEDALTTKMREIKKILDHKGSLNDVKKFFESNDIAA